MRAGRAEFLAQFPASFKNEPASIGYLEWLLDAFKDYQLAIELRHRSFSDDPEGTLRLLRSEFVGPVNIGSDEMVTINQLAGMVIAIAAKDLTVNNIPGPLGVRGRNSDNRLIRQMLGWAPSQSLQAGLETTYAWVGAQVDKRHNSARK